MSDENDPTLSGPGTPVPDLIEQYRVRRDAWIAQADELARLRDEVRGSAEHEAMEIVTAARRNVRQIVMDARRELLVLSAQVQAALGEGASSPDPTALLNRARAADAEGDIFTTSSHELSDSFAPEEAVRSMLDEARADMDALAEDARAVPLQAMAPPVPPLMLVPPMASLPEAPSESEPESLSELVSESFPEPLPLPEILPEPLPERLLEAMPERRRVSEPDFDDSPALSAPTSRVLLSSPFASESVPVPAGRPLRTFVVLFGVAGLAIVLATIWWNRSPTAATTPPETPSRAESQPSSAPVSSAGPTSPAPAASPEPAADVAPANLSLTVEARRPAWIRATVDGDADAGRMYAAGEKLQLTAARSVDLRVGDAGAVYVSVNKGEALPLGRDGQVVTRQFVIEGAKQSDAPAAPAQPPAPAPQKPVEAPTVPTASAPSTPPPSAPPILQSVAAVAGPPTGVEPGPVATVSRAETTPPPIPRPEVAPPSPSTPTNAVIGAAQMWLDAYHRQDRSALNGLQTDGLQVSDERRNEERFPPGVGVMRTLDGINVQIAADTAVLTAVMTERSPDPGAMTHVSPVSQVWVLSGGQWRVRQVRLVSEARLNKIFR